MPSDTPAPRPIEVLPGLWEGRAIHPEWSQENDGWEPEVAWWALETDAGLVLIDPLITGDWDWLDERVTRAGGRTAIVRTIRWHQRSIPEARTRYGAELWARKLAPGDPAEDVPSDHTQPDHAVADGDRLPGGVVTHWLSNADELAVWLPDAQALVFGDAMLRDAEGRLHRCPDSWLSSRRGSEQLRRDLEQLVTLVPRHILVAHGPSTLGDGPGALQQAASSDSPRA